MRWPKLGPTDEPPIGHVVGAFIIFALGLALGIFVCSVLR